MKLWLQFIFLLLAARAFAHVPATAFVLPEFSRLTYDQAWNLVHRTNYTFVQSFNVNEVNELTSGSRLGNLPVAGNVSTTPTSVTVKDNANSPVAAEIFDDASFVRTNVPLNNGNNTFVAVAQDSLGREDTSTVTAYLPASPSYTYDDRGNLTSDGLRSFTYDDENQLIQVSVANAWKSEFSYDGFRRRRIVKDYTWQSGAWVKTNEVRYIYDGMLVVQERDASNLPRITYTRGNDLSGSLQGAGGIGGLLARTSNSQLLSPDSSSAHAYYHADGNGNITAMEGVHEGLVAQYSYDPFGNLLGMTGPLAEANKYRFSSKEWHANSGLYYYGFRFYEPNLQRWLNQDPIGEFGGINLYGFVGNQSVSSIDFDGRFLLSLTFLLYDIYNTGQKLANGTASLSDGLWLALDVAALGADLLTGGTGGTGLQVALAGTRAIRAAHTAQAISAADKALAAAQGARICMGAGTGGGSNWFHDFMPESEDDDKVDDNFPIKERMPAGDNKHFNDMFAQVMKENGIARESPQWEQLHRAASDSEIAKNAEINALRQFILDWLGKSV